MSRFIAVSRNAKKLTVILFVSSVICFLFLQNNAQLQQQISSGHKFFRQLSELRSNSDTIFSDTINIQSSNVQIASESVKAKPKVVDKETQLLSMILCMMEIIC